MRLVFAGTPAVALPSLDALASGGHEIVAVLTRPDAPAGRGRALLRSPVARWADERGVPVLQPRRLTDPGALDELAALAPDCCPVVAYGALVPKAALDLPVHGWVNLHFSLLPAWRGAAPVQRALMAGDDLTGASTFRLEEGLDTGPVYGVLTERVRPDDTSGTVLDRLAVAGAALLVATVDGIATGTVEARPQPADGISLAPKVSVEEARVDWSLTPVAVDRRIRGCTPEPGAWTTFRGERLKLGPVAPLVPTPATGTGAGAQTGPGADGDPAQAADAVRGLPPGALVVQRRRVLVAAAGGALVLGDVQPTGRKAMPAADWARGVRPEPGEGLL